MRERNKSQRRNPPTMHKEMIHKFFLLTYRASTWTTKTTSFEHVLNRNLVFGGRQVKKHAFVGVLDFQMELQTVLNKTLYGLKTP